jgi:sortase A
VRSGNFAVAAHRTSYGKPFNGLGNLRVGDHLFVETQDGWYQYAFRNLEYVRPTGVGVIGPVPQMDGATPEDRIMTMTSCNPMFSAAERIIAYSVFQEFYPRADGPPDEIAATVGGKS